MQRFHPQIGHGNADLYGIKEVIAIRRQRVSLPWLRKNEVFKKGHMW